MLTSKISVTFFFSLLLSLTVKSQQEEQFSFTHFGLADGLASNIINNIVQDSSGFIWLSTNNGLQRFDGNKFITFRSREGNLTSLPSDEVNQVFRDRNHNLWVLTADNKVGLFNTRTFTYQEIPVKKPNIERLYVEKTFIETEDGHLLLHFRKTNKLFQYDKIQKIFIPSTAIPFPQYWTVNYILQDKASQKYFMATDSGFVVYNRKTKHLNTSVSNPDKEPVLNHCGNERFINFLFIDSRRQLFYEQWPKNNKQPTFQVFNLKNGAKDQHNFTKEYGLGYHQIKAVMEQKSGKLWIYGLPFLAEYIGGSRPLKFLKRDYNKEKDLKFNQVFSLYEDRQKNMWVCTDNGIYLFNPDAQFFHNYTLTTPKRFFVEGRSQSAFQFPNGEIWIGYRDLGLHRYDKNINPLPLPAAIVPLQENLSIWDMHLHQKTGKLWITMQGGRLIVYDTLTHKAQLFTPPPFEQRAITQVAEDRKGNLWFGTQAGNIVKWDMEKGKTNIADGFRLVMRTGIVEKLFTDSRGHVWVAAIGAGVMDIDTDTDQVVAQISKDNKSGFDLWNNNPKDIIQFDDSTLIVASGALNLVNIKNYRVQQISNRDGLPTNTVQSLVKDASGLLWLGTMNGLCVADIKRLAFTVYNQSDGLLNDHFSVAGAHSLQDGQLLFMSVESFLIFDPAQTRIKDNTASVIITDFKLMNVSLPLDSLLAMKQITLPHNKTYVTIEFSALDYNRLNKLDYYYQLEGFDTTWIRSDNRHQAIYTFLSSGNYTFKIKTKTINDEWSPENSYLELLVKPPFYKSWWFVVLVVALIATVLYLLYRERIKRLVTLHNIRSDIASHLHQDVSTTLNNINVLSQIAKLKADRDINRSKELIDEISGKSYNMMVSMDEILWSIDPNNDTMEKTLFRIVEFSKTLESNYTVTIDIVVHEKVKALRLDMKVRHDFFITCKAALQQLAQYAKGENIMMDIDLAWSKIIVKMLSAGIDSEEDKLAMQDLKKNMEERAAAMHASLLFETGKRDTAIILSIPVRPHSVVPYTIFSNRK